MKKKIIIFLTLLLLITITSPIPEAYHCNSIISNFNNQQSIKNDDYITPFGTIFVFGLSVDVKLLQLEPGEDYVDLEILNQPLYIWENGLFQPPITRNPGEFIRLYNARGLFHNSISLCMGVCTDWAIIG